MKLVKNSLILLMTAITLACSPKITTQITNKKPPNTVTDDSPIAVFTNENTIPLDAQVLGRTSVEDGGATIKCDSTTVINLVKDVARKSGGNAVFVEEHIRPSLWSSCHQMKANILYIGDFTPPPMNQSAETTARQAPKYFFKQTIPRMSLSLSGGYGWRTANIHPDLAGFQREMAYKLSKGAVWDASITYHFNDYIGLAMTYWGYFSSLNLTAHAYGYGNTSLLKHKDMITFVCPSFITTYPIEKWIFTAAVGLGYLQYDIKETFPGNYLKIRGSSVGVNSTLGCEYRISESFSIGLDFGALYGRINSLRVNNNGVVSNQILDNKDSESLDLFRISAGIRYRFLKK
ncbi:MAG: hypothetical protein LBC98_10655 [Prevotellaceae bacterium]|nr:hypothetical protein [Prevotellaceae bacterium]